MEQQNLPRHMPVDMALAPDQKPYEHTHIIHTPKATTEENKLAQHSLSPEKLGVVGYVKDVAGFVKDVVHERQEKKALQRRNSASSQEGNSNRLVEDQQQQPQTERRRSSAEHLTYQPTPLAGAVTGLFPGVAGQENAAGCTHADDLRSQMMHINEEQHDPSRVNKIL